MQSVTLIHPFKVNSELEKTFLDAWQAVDQYMKQQPGFIKTQLHRSLESGNVTDLSFVNVAIWNTAASFKTAIDNPLFKKLAKDVLMFSGGAKLYEVFCE